jgi:cysteinyl-tRNA synthetase
VNHWVHNGFVEVDGEKMSKSLGNFTELGDIIRSGNARAYRLLAVRAHYRSPQEITRSSVADAAGALERLDAFARRAGDLASGTPDPEVVARFRELMDDDLNTPGAVALLFESVRKANSALDLEDDATAGPLAAAVVQLFAVLGLELGEGAAEPIPTDVAALAAQRDEARAAKDWAAADELRQKLTDLGWTVEDGAGGTVVRRS